MLMCLMESVELPGKEVRPEESILALSALVPLFVLCTDIALYEDVAGNEFNVVPGFNTQFLLCDPENDDVEDEVCNDDGNGEVAGGSGGGGFFLLLHEPLSLREDKSLTLEDLLVFVFSGLLSDGEGMTMGTGDNNEGALNPESIKLNAVAACGKAAVYDMMELVSTVVANPVDDKTGAVITQDGGKTESLMSALESPALTAAFYQQLNRNVFVYGFEDECTNPLREFFYWKKH
eukprot:g45914.t1